VRYSKAGTSETAAKSVTPCFCFQLVIASG